MYDIKTLIVHIVTMILTNATVLLFSRDEESTDQPFDINASETYTVLNSLDIPYINYFLDTIYLHATMKCTLTFRPRTENGNEACINIHPTNCFFRRLKKHTTTRFNTTTGYLKMDCIPPLVFPEKERTIEGSKKTKNTATNQQQNIPQTREISHSASKGKK